MFVKPARLLWSVFSALLLTLLCMHALMHTQTYTYVKLMFLRPRLHETGTKSIRDGLVSVIVLFIIDVLHETVMKNA